MVRGLAYRSMVQNVFTISPRRYAQSPVATVIFPFMVGVTVAEDQDPLCYT